MLFSENTPLSLIERLKYYFRTDIKGWWSGLSGRAPPSKLEFKPQYCQKKQKQKQKKINPLQ
jgi:hypothetical protein